MNLSLIVSLIAAGWLAQQPAPQAPVTPPPSSGVQGKPVSANLKVRISTSTYLPDGRVLTASASDWPLRLNEAVVAYAGGGKTVCEPTAPTLQQPEPPAQGWRVEITPVREGAGELEVRVLWRQHSSLIRLAGKDGKARFVRGSVGPSSFGSTATLTLHAGDRVVLDYQTGSQATPFVNGYRLRTTLGDMLSTTANQPSQSGGCNAVGMSLEVGLEPAKTEALVEAELWLVRPNKDGTERSDRQVLRLPVGHPASRYFFDEARLAGPSAGSDTFAKVSGELSAIAIENGKIRLSFKVSRRDGKSPEVDLSGTYRDLVAVPGEVLAFQLPPPGAQSQPPLSIRLRANVLR